MKCRRDVNAKFFKSKMHMLVNNNNNDDNNNNNNNNNRPS